MLITNKSLSPGNKLLFLVRFCFVLVFFFSCLQYLASQSFFFDVEVNVNVIVV